MRVAAAEHRARTWRIHELTAGFRLEDVWVPPSTGGPDDFPRLVELVASYDPLESSSCIVRTLFAVRFKLGDLLGLDAPATGVGERVPTLRDRLPADLRDGPRGPDFGPFTSLYLTDDEWAVEAANQTMHGLIHVGRVPIADGGFQAQVAIYVKPNGLLGHAYMAFIKPFRYALVYPAMFTELDRAWQNERTPAH